MSSENSIPRNDEHVNPIHEFLDEQDPDVLYRKAKDGDDKDRPTALMDLVRLLLSVDPFTVAQFRERAKRDGLADKTTFDAALRQAQAEQHEPPKAYTQNGEFVQVVDKALVPTDDELGQRWLDRRDGETAYGLGDWRRYQAGHWPAIESEAIHSEIRRVLVDAKREGVKPTKGRLESVAELARVHVFVASDRWDADPYIVVCENGALDLRAFKLREHSQRDYATSRVPYPYDPGAACPTFQRVLRDTIPGAAAMLSLHEEVAPRELDARLLLGQLRKQGAVVDEEGIRGLNAISV